VSPAWYDDYVLTVGSVNVRGEPSAFSMAGPWVDVAAPGEGVVSLSSTGNGLANAVDGQHGSTPLSGTSYAAPVVAGLAALIRSRFPTWTARQVMQRIKATAHHPPAGWDPLVGAGLVDVLAAVSTDTPIAPPAPPARTSAPIVEPSRVKLPDHRARNTAFIGAGISGGLLAVMLALGATWTRLRRTQVRPDKNRNILCDRGIGSAKFRPGR
jgi:membrane-anchored mycosin MYCP